MNLYNKEERVEINKNKYHELKNKLTRGVDIIAIPQRFGKCWVGYKYYISKELVR